jgi:hypothetical protein
VNDVYQKTGNIIVRARYIESQLKVETGSKAQGLHEVVSGMVIGDDVQPEIIKKIRFVASVRNSAAHDTDFDVTPEKVSAFNAACDEIEAFFAWPGHDVVKADVSGYHNAFDGIYKETMEKVAQREDRTDFSTWPPKSPPSESPVQRNARKALRFGLELAVALFKPPYR